MVDWRKKWRRRFIARYIVYLEVFGYLFVGVVVVAIALLFFFKVDDVSQAYSNPLIKPHEQEVSQKTDVIVLNVLVRNHAEVAKEQPLAEVCDDPAWVRRYQAAQHSDSLIAALDRTADRRELMPDEKVLQEALKKASEHWEMRLARMPKVFLRAPLAGVAVVEDGLAGQVVPAGKEIVHILDFNDLRISSDLRGANLADARVGQPIKVEALTTYGNGEILRGDFDRSGQWRWKKRHGQFNSVAAGKIKDILQDHFKGEVVTLEEDTLFAVSKVTEVDLQGTLHVEDAPDAGGGLDPEPFSETPILGHVIEGTHTALVRFLDLPDSLQARVEGALLEKLKAQVVRSLDGSAFSVKGIRDLKVTVKMEGDEKGLKKAYLDGAEPLLTEKVERKFIFEAKIDNPSPALKAKVRELALAGTPTYIKTKTEVVVGQRRIAMLLFRKD